MNIFMISSLLLVPVFPEEKGLIPNQEVHLGELERGAKGNFHSIPVQEEGKKVVMGFSVWP